jgi:hypothetical protein
MGLHPSCRWRLASPPLRPCGPRCGGGAARTTAATSAAARTCCTPMSVGVGRTVAHAAAASHAPGPRSATQPLGCDTTRRERALRAGRAARPCARLRGRPRRDLCPRLRRCLCDRLRHDRGRSPWATPGAPRRWCRAANGGPRPPTRQRRWSSRRTGPRPWRRRRYAVCGGRRRRERQGLRAGIARGSAAGHRAGSPPPLRPRTTKGRRSAPSRSSWPRPGAHGSRWAFFWAATVIDGGNSETLRSSRPSSPSWARRFGGSCGRASAFRLPRWMSSSSTKKTWSRPA